MSSNGTPAKENGGTSIEIKTPAGVVRCLPDEIILKRLGVQFEHSSILLEYEVPGQRIIAIHTVAVDLRWIGSSVSPGGTNASYVAMAEKLQSVHEPWLGKVNTAQIAKLIGRLGSAVATSPGPRAKAKAKPRRARVQGLPPTARARKSSKVEEVRKVFDDIGVSGQSSLSSEDLHGYLCDYLGFGQAEAIRWFEHHKAPDGGVSFDTFREGYAELNPYMVMNLQKEVIIRKPGSLDNQQVNLEKLEDCEVYICDTSAQVFADFCKRCLVLIGPCESSAFIRDCEDCTFWLAVKQFRTNNCVRCNFFLYAKTEPIIETSKDLSFAPWSAHYPKCTEHFSRAGFKPNENLWNAVFDFSGEEGRSNWRIMPMDEVVDLKVDLDEPPTAAALPDNPCSPVTHGALCAPPLTSGESCGEGVHPIPQTRPALPPSPASASPARVCSVQDARPTWQVGAQHLRERAPAK
mmetsp:Transcript_104680/g.296242  ORF Transcript_104680/g.296242 Transcript_104680/m.296242 type:complete len:463 (+) Transcript_104680:186-1574(+)